MLEKFWPEEFWVEVPDDFVHGANFRGKIFGKKLSQIVIGAFHESTRVFVRFWLWPIVRWRKILVFTRPEVHARK